MEESYRTHCSNFCCWISTESTNILAAGGPSHSRSVVWECSLPQATSVDTAVSSICSARLLLLDDQLKCLREEKRE